MDERGDEGLSGTPMCEFCSGEHRTATCVHRAGLSVSFVDDDGNSYDDPDRFLFLCDDCCGHSGEEGACYSLRDLVALKEQCDRLREALSNLVAVAECCPDFQAPGRPNCDAYPTLEVARLVLNEKGGAA